MEGERAITFRCAGEDLVGILHRRGDPCRDTVVLVVVGGPQYRVGSHRQFVMLARAIADAGYAVLRFDYRGMGDSSGESRSFDAINDDIRAAVDALTAAVPAVRNVVIFGLCDAASAALLYSGCDPRVGGLVLANPWVRSDAGAAAAYVRHYYPTRLLSRSFWKKLLAGEVNIVRSLGSLISSVRRATTVAPGGDASIPPFVDRMRESFLHFNGRVLLLISERDLTAKEFLSLCAGSREWARAVGRPAVRINHLDGADHTFSTRSALELCNALVLSWLAQHDSTADAPKRA